MKVNLNMVKEKARVNSLLMMGIIMKVILKMINLMVKDILNLMMEENIKEIGKKMK